jgi:hypothetical protein
MTNTRLSLLAALAGMALLAAGANASAATYDVTFSSVSDKSIGPQSASSPCVISGANCTPQTITYTNYGNTGAVSDYTASSPTYTVQQLEGIIGTAFQVALDVNTTQAAGETLQSFTITIDGDTYSLANSINVGSVANNGTGYADWISSVIDLSKYASTDSVVFSMHLTGTSDGAESFFLWAANAPAQLPIPGALPLFATGLGMLGLLRLRRKRAAAV